MKKLFFLFVILNFSLRAQDSICYVSGESKAIKIVEVTSFGVKYSNWHDTKGNVVFALKKDIAYIRYANGDLSFLEVKKKSTVADENISSGPQDTISFRNGTIKTGKVDLVGTYEIKYIRKDNTNGVTYTVSKNDIRFIKYSNGIVDSFSIVTPPEIKITNIPVAEERIVFRRNNLFLGKRVLNHRDLGDLIMTCTDTKKAKLLQTSLVKIKKYNPLSKTFLPIGIASLCALPGTWAFLAWFVSPQYARITIPILLTIGITSFVLHVYYKNKLTEERRRFLKVYCSNF